MILPRRLMTLADGRFCEEDDPKQAMNFHGKGYQIPDAEAERIGLKAYLDETGWGEKAREKGERKVTEAQFTRQLEADRADEGTEEGTEGKAVAQATTEDKAVPEPSEAKADEKKDEEHEGTTGSGLQVDRTGGSARGRRGGT